MYLLITLCYYLSLQSYCWPKVSDKCSDVKTSIRTVVEENDKKVKTQVKYLKFVLKYTAWVNVLLTTLTTTDLSVLPLILVGDKIKSSFISLLKYVTCPLLCLSFITSTVYHSSAPATVAHPSNCSKKGPYHPGRQSFSGALYTHVHWTHRKPH